MSGETAIDFQGTLSQLRAQPRPTREQVIAGAARLLNQGEVGQLRTMASAMPDLTVMLSEWIHSGRPLTDRDLNAMRQAYTLWTRFSNAALERAVDRCR